MIELEADEEIITLDDIKWFNEIIELSSIRHMGIKFFTKKRNGELSAKMADIILSSEN